MSRPFWASARKAAARRYDEAAMMTDRSGKIEHSIPQHREALKSAFAEGYEEASKEWAKLDAPGVASVAPAELLRELVEADKAWAALHPIHRIHEVEKGETRLQAAWKAARAHVFGVPAVDAVSRELLAAGLRSGDAGTFGLAAQLAGVPACDGCGYRKEFCRCAAGAALPAPLGWWTDELEKIYTAKAGTPITLDMKRAAHMALTIAHGGRWDDEKQEWTHGVKEGNDGR